MSSEGQVCQSLTVRKISFMQLHSWDSRLHGYYNVSLTSENAGSVECSSVGMGGYLRASIEGENLLSGKPVVSLNPHVKVHTAGDAMVGTTRTLESSPATTMRARPKASSGAQPDCRSALLSGMAPHNSAIRAHSWEPARSGRAMRTPCSALAAIMSSSSTSNWEQ